MGRHMLPWLPTSLFLSWKFDSMAKLPTIPCPMFFVHGQSDSTIPPFMQDQLAAAATGAASVTVVKVPGAEHNDIFIYGPDSGQDVWRKLGRFMKGE
jgi:fermentation-respiration switch protein FrsA (DUF1100 family)